MALGEMLIIIGILIFLLAGAAFVILMIVILVRFISKKNENT